MDRSYKAHDKVHVYQWHKDGKLLATFSQQPYSDRGFDNYRYKNVMYPGFIDLHSDERKVYILLCQPLL